MVAALRSLVAALVTAPCAFAAAQPPAIHRPLALAPGACQASLVVESNESVRRRFEPISLAPDLHCGAHRRLTLGITHSARAISRVDSGSGLCLGGEGRGCDAVYGGTALDAVSPIRGGYDPDVAVAGRARLVLASYSPLRPSVRLGGLIRLRRGAAAMVLDPHLSIGLASRDRGNRDQLNLPIVGQFQLGARAVLSIRSGVRGELATFGDALAIPLAAGVELSPSPVCDVGIDAGFPRLLGPQNTTKERHVALHVTFRFDPPWALPREAPSSAHSR